MACRCTALSQAITHQRTTQLYRSKSNDQLNRAWRLLRNPNSDDVAANVFVYLQNAASRVSGASTRTCAAIAAVSEASRTVLTVVAPVADSGGTLKSITEAHIREAHARIVEGRLDPLGSMTRAYLARDLASRDIPAPRAPIRFKRPNICLQMQFMDSQKILEDPDMPEARTIKFKINGAWVPIEVDVKSLRKALRFPDMDLTRLGLFDGDDGRL